MSINLEAYRLKDIQKFISLLDQFEGEGVSDVRFVRERLSRNLTRRAGKVGRIIGIPTKYKKQPDYGNCPDCKNNKLVGIYRVDGLEIVRCSAKCGFSKVVK